MRQNWEPKTVRKKCQQFTSRATCSKYLTSKLSLCLSFVMFTYPPYYMDSNNKRMPIIFINVCGVEVIRILTKKKQRKLGNFLRISEKFNLNSKRQCVALPVKRYLLTVLHVYIESCMRTMSRKTIRENKKKHEKLLIN